MMKPTPGLLRQAMTKAECAYGQSIRDDLGKAIRRLHERHGWLERCMQVLAISLPKALVWQRIRHLRKGLAPGPESLPDRRVQALVKHDES
jgi:hypothetical protein